jgi:hypothetical protein
VTLGETDRSGMEIEASGSGDKCVSIVVIIGRCARTETERRHSQKRAAKGGKFVGRSMSPRRHMRECGCDGRVLCAPTECEPGQQKKGPQGDKWAGRAMRPGQHMGECFCDTRSCVHQLKDEPRDSQKKASRERRGLL